MSMKQITILFFLVVGVVEMFAAAEASFIFGFPNEEAALKSSEVEHVRPAVDKFIHASDPKPVGLSEFGTCSCKDSVNISHCECSLVLRRDESDLNGNFTVELTSFSGKLNATLYFGGKFVCFANAEMSGKFSAFACIESKVTKGETVCLLIVGDRYGKYQPAHGLAYVFIRDTELFTVVLGRYSFYSHDPKADEGKKAWTLDKEGFLKLVETEEQILLMEERILMKKNFPGMDDEML